jgi:hypothetical protein
MKMLTYKWGYTEYLARYRYWICLDKYRYTYRYPVGYRYRMLKKLANIQPIMTVAL